jgi:hypothetical protein
VPSTRGALDIKLPKHARKELEGHLDCGVLCRDFARLRCGACRENRLVAVRPHITARSADPEGTLRYLRGTDVSYFVVL